MWGGQLTLAFNRCFGSPALRLWLAAGLVAALPAITLWTIASLPDLSRSARMRDASIEGLFRPTPEVLGALAVYVLFVAISLTLILSVARGGKASHGLVRKRLAGLSSTALLDRDADSVGPPGTGSVLSVRGDLRRLAEQVRLDAGDTLHAMRSPLATVVGAVDMLRRVISADDARARRALELAEVAAERLVAMADEAWHASDALAEYYLAPHACVDLGRVIMEVASDRFHEDAPRGIKILCHVVAECPVVAPEGMLKLIVEGVFEALCDTLPAGVTLNASASSDSSQVYLEISAAAGSLEWEMERLVPRDLARSVTLLGGRLEVAAAVNDTGSLRLVLPRHG